MRVLLGSLLACAVLGFVGLGCRPAALEAEAPTAAVTSRMEGVVGQKKENTKPGPGGAKKGGGKKTGSGPAGAAGDDGVDKGIQLQEWTAPIKVPAYDNDGKPLKGPFETMYTAYAGRHIRSATSYFIVLNEAVYTAEQAKELIAVIDDLKKIKEVGLKAPATRRRLEVWWGPISFYHANGEWRVGENNEFYVIYGKPEELKKAVKEALEALDQLKKVKQSVEW